MTSQDRGSRARVLIEPGRTERNYWLDLWRYRELMCFLAWRDITVRYKQTAIGVIWALLRPALTMLVFVAFRKMARLSAGAAPDPILVFAAVLPWQFFSTALTESSGSLIGNENLISKVYFPRLIVPFASVVTSLVDFTITLGLLLALMAWYRYVPSWTIIALPVFTLLTFLLSLGLGLLLAALNVKYRDFRYIVPFLVQFGLFVSPIAFGAGDVPKRWRVILDFNPITGIINGFRWVILGGHPSLDLGALTVSVVATGSLLFLGIRYFRRTESGFADVI
jgi:lipopolysaccharide transport system permease protein